MVSKLKLYLYWLRFWCLAPFLLQGLTYVKLCACTQNQPQKVGTCPGLPLQPVSHNQIFQNYRPEPSPNPLKARGGGGGVNTIFSVFTCDRAAEDKQVEKNRIKIQLCISEILHVEV